MSFLNLRRMKMIKKRVVFLLTFMLIVSSISMTLGALYYPNEFYSHRVTSYTYTAPVTSSYNCLGYATGSMIWEWPWNLTYKPTPENVAFHLNATYGYNTTTVGNGTIISYGTSSEITHFSKAIGLTSVEAKWGQLERFTHSSRNCYPAVNSGTDTWGSYGYGVAIAGYKK